MYLYGIEGTEGCAIMGKFEAIFVVGKRSRRIRTLPPPTITCSNC